MKPQSQSNDAHEKTSTKLMLQKPTLGRSQKAPAKATNAEDGHSSPGFEPRRLLTALVAARNGDFSVRLPSDWTGLEGKIADAFNDIIMSNEMMARELERVSHAVGKEGKIRQRASFSSGGGAWRGMQDSVNTL